MKNKELLLKIVISISSIFGVMTCIFAFILEGLEEGTAQYNFYNVSTMILVGVCFILAIIMYIMMTKIKITPKNISSHKLIINSENYEQFETMLIEQLNNNGFSDIINIPNGLGCSMKYVYKTTFNTLQIIMLLRVEELSENIQDNYYQCFGEFIQNNHADNISKDFEIIHCVCVDRITPSFKSYIEKHVEQPYGRYHLPVGVSFGGRTVYIAPQKGGFFEVKYHELFKILKQILQSQIVEDK
jgi:hypothetical protein